MHAAGNSHHCTTQQSIADELMGPEILTAITSPSLTTPPRIRRSSPSAPRAPKRSQLKMSMKQKAEAVYNEYAHKHFKNLRDNSLVAVMAKDVNDCQVIGVFRTNERLTQTAKVTDPDDRYDWFLYLYNRVWYSDDTFAGIISTLTHTKFISTKTNIIPPSAPLQTQ